MTFYSDNEMEPYEDDLSAHEENEVFLDREFDVEEIEELDFENFFLESDDLDLDDSDLD